MNNTNQNSTNVLAEKLALSREFAVLQPELEHLRSQLAHQQATLAAKLALERQVNTLEVELANEKKATRRAMQKCESTDQVEDDLRKQLREAEKELVAEKAQRGRLEDHLAQEKRTHQLSLEDQDSTRDLESDLRKKLQDAQRQLRESREHEERLQEELNAEKRQAQKAQKQQHKNESAGDDELRGHLEETQRNLLATQKQAEKLRIDAQESLDTADRRSNAFEQKFEKLKTKYRELQDQLKQCQADLKMAQKAQASKPSVVEEIDMKTAGRQAFKKRKVDDISNNNFSSITIATPSADDKPRKVIKKKAVEPSLLGEKSTFSITPFLNRSKNLAVDDAADESEIADTSYIPQNKQGKSPAVQANQTAAVPVPAAADTSAPSPEASSSVSEEQAEEKPKPQVKARGRPKTILGDAASAKKNAKPMPKTALKKTSRPSPPLEMVAEEGEDNIPEPAEKTQTVKFNFTLPQDSSTSSTNTSKAEEPKKKKRKVLGSTKTLFDDEDEAVAPIATKAVSKGPPGGAKKRAPLAGVRNAFAGSTFSPLKRDRRGVGASFLA